MEPEASESEWEDLKPRVISALVLLVLAAVCVSLGGIVFSALVIYAAILMINEWQVLVAEQKPVFRITGYIYVILPSACVLWLRSLEPASDPLLGFKLVFGLAAIISATDIGAYFSGKRFGTFALAPAISPKKTWEGLAGGVLAATLTGMCFAPYINLPKAFVLVLLVSPVIALIAQGGDLFKSWVKRRAGVKDSGSLIPGHGGVIDRLDGYMFATPILAVIVYFALKAAS